MKTEPRPSGSGQTLIFLLLSLLLSACTTPKKEFFVAFSQCNNAEPYRAAQNALMTKLFTEAGGVKYRVGHFSFFQVNRFLVDDLVRTVCDEENGRLALDLFAGVGLFSIPLAKHFERLIAVESNPAAVRDLETNMRGQGTIEVRTADVDRFLERNKERPEFVVLDPPRDGLAPDAAKRLGRMQPSRITYVSCEPPTLARDLAVLAEAGYDCTEIHLFDLFPQTFHMETVARLRRRE